MVKYCLWKQDLGEVLAPLESNVPSGSRPMVLASRVLWVQQTLSKRVWRVLWPGSSPGVGSSRLVLHYGSPLWTCVHLEKLVKFSETQLLCLKWQWFYFPPCCYHVHTRWCPGSIIWHISTLTLRMLSPLDFWNKVPSWFSSYVTGCFLSVSSAGTCFPPQLLALVCARFGLGPHHCSVYTHLPQNKSQNPHSGLQSYNSLSWLAPRLLLRDSSTPWPTCLSHPDLQARTCHGALP